MSPNKVLAIGLDAGDLNFIETRLELLPNLAKLLDRSQVYRPQSPLGLSGSVWPTFYTGSEPGHHGIYQHLLWNPERMGLKLIDSSWCRRAPFWKKLDEQGVRTPSRPNPDALAPAFDHDAAPSRRHGAAHAHQRSRHELPQQPGSSGILAAAMGTAGASNARRTSPIRCDG